MHECSLGELDEALMERLLRLAEETATQILRVYRRDFGVREKADQTPVTEADLLAHRTLVAGLEAIAPGIPVISEEAAPAPFAQRCGWREYWLLDPLDGTREFIRGSGEFSTNIALIRAGEPVLGIVHAPTSGLSYHARRGAGAYRRERGGADVAIRTRTAPKRPVVAVSRARRGARLQRLLRNLGPHEAVVLGSSLKTCLVAEGRADLYPGLGPTSEWDTAAPQCILEEAGGALTDLALRPLRYNTRQTLLNPPFIAFGDPHRGWGQYL